MALVNYSDLKTSVADWLNRTDLTTTIPDFITLAEAGFNKEIRNRKMIKRATATIDSQYSAVPADWLQTVDFVIESNPIVTLEFITNEQLDKLREQSNNLTKIGTTGRGIGTSYEDKVGRRSVRVSDLYNEDKLKDKLTQSLDFYNSVFEHSFGATKIDLNELLDLNLKQAEKLKPYVGNVIQEIRTLQDNEKKILYEGAQGALLDVSLGTYPFVTSSNLIGGISAGTGISPSDIDYTIGITKAYTTRVGEGPFPTELFDEMGTYLAETGGEVGATTGRPRRCGWLDGFLLENMVKSSGVDGLCLTKIDVLDGLEKIKICINYESNHSEADLIETMDLEDAKPIYIELEGWEEPTAGKTSFEELNEKAKSFIEKIEEISGVPVIMISTGPKREDTIIRQKI